MGVSQWGCDQNVAKWSLRYNRPTSPSNWASNLSLGCWCLSTIVYSFFESWMLTFLHPTMEVFPFTWIFHGLRRSPEVKTLMMWKAPKTNGMIVINDKETFQLRWSEFLRSNALAIKEHGQCWISCMFISVYFWWLVCSNNKYVYIYIYVFFYKSNFRAKD